MKKISPDDLKTLPVGTMIQYISDTILHDVPESMDTEYNIHQMEVLLSRLPNSYAYIVTLLSYARHYVREYKRSGEKELYEDMMDKRDALESIASAIKLQYQGVSRKITLYEQKYDAVNMWEYRNEERKDNGNSNTGKPAW